MNTSYKAITTLLIVMMLAGCAGKRAAKNAAEEGAAKGTPQDMTRPPTTIGADRKIVVESNPDETISFEEWKRLQSADADDQQPAETEDPSDANTDGNPE